MKMKLLIRNDENRFKITHGYSNDRYILHTFFYVVEC